MKKRLKKRFKLVDVKVNLYANEYTCEGGCGCTVSSPGTYCAGADGCDCGCGCGGSPDKSDVDD